MADPKHKIVKIRIPKGVHVTVEFEYVEQGEVELQSDDWIKVGENGGSTGGNPGITRH